MLESKRTTEEYIVLALSGGSCIGVLPFVFMRFVKRDWLIGAIDLLAVLMTASLFFYVFRTGKTLIPGRILACFCITMVFVTVAIKGAAQTVWIYPALSAIFFLLNTYIAAILCAIMLVAMGVIIWPQLDAFVALQVYVTVLATLLFSYAFANRMRYQQAQLETLATRDPLTDAGNRRALEEKLLSLRRHDKRFSDHNNSLIILDIDKFKQINDTHGHCVGDDILIKLARLIQKRIRNTDTLYRFGGEEFVIIAENTSLADAAKLAQDLRQAVEANKNMAEYAVTISLGTAQFKDDETPFEWLGRADKAMYSAKDAGRNTCCVAA